MDVLTLETIDFSSDLDELKIHEIARKVSYICEFGHGIFYLKPESEQISEIINIIDEAKEFFSLPENEKYRLANDESCNYKIQGISIPGTGSGYRGKGCDPNFAFDTRESFNICSEAFDEKKKTGCGKNKWTSEALMTPNWTGRIISYSNIMLDLAIKMRSIIGGLRYILNVCCIDFYLMLGDMCLFQFFSNCVESGIRFL